MERLTYYTSLPYVFIFLNQLLAAPAVQRENKGERHKGQETGNKELSKKRHCCLILQKQKRINSLYMRGIKKNIYDASSQPMGKQKGREEMRIAENSISMVLTWCLAEAWFYALVHHRWDSICWFPGSAQYTSCKLKMIERVKHTMSVSQYILDSLGIGKSGLRACCWGEIKFE